MSLFDYFKANQNNDKTAQKAKERLQILVAHARSRRGAPDYLPRLEQELIEVIRKYVSVDPEHVTMQHEHNQDDELSILELNIVLPEEKT